MKQRRWIIGLGLVSGMMVLLLNLLSAPLLQAAPVPAVLITEVQTGGQTAGEEFVELYNASDQAVDITGWQLRYRNAASASTTLLATIGGVDGSGPLVLPAHTHYVVHTAAVPLPAASLGQVYAATLSAADKAIGLFAPDRTSCKASVRDAVAWGTASGGEGRALAVSGTTERLLQRAVTTTGVYLDSNDNLLDFVGVAEGATPGLPNTVPPPSPEPAATTPATPMPPSVLSDCELPSAGPVAPPSPAPVSTPSPEPAVPVAAVPPPAVIEPEPEDNEPEAKAPEASPAPQLPPRNAGLFAPQLSELLPNPAKPQTDAADEYIELYNANAAVFELSGFVLETGTTRKKRYTFPAGTLLPPKSFTAFYSRDTTLTLANTTGQVRLLDPLGRLLEESAAYETAKDGQAWLHAKDKWQWTTVATPAALNVVKIPATKSKTKSPAVGSVKAASTHAAAAGAANTAKSEGTAGDSAPGSVTSATTTPDEDGGFSPLHPGVLALTGVIAVLYGAYEYRRDLANKLYQFRANRRARAEARAAAKGR